LYHRLDVVELVQALLLRIPWYPRHALFSCQRQRNAPKSWCMRVLGQQLAALFALQWLPRMDKAVARMVSGATS
jgi:hypothetical protein